MLKSGRFSYRFPRALSFVLVPLLLLLAAPLTGQPVQMTHAATTIEVTNGNDSGAGSLRQVIADAAAGATITFADSVDTVTLTSDQLTIDKDLTIDGGDGVTIERSSEAGTPDFRIFEITGTDTDATLDSLTIRNGKAPDGTASDGNGSDGGGIYNSGTVTVTNSTISDNTTGDGDTASAGGNGGGIANIGTLTINNSTITSNTTGSGGACSPSSIVGVPCASSGGNGGNGAGVFNSGTVTMSTPTISNNITGSGKSGSGAGRGGNGGGISNSGTMTISDGSISNNSTGKGGYDVSYGGIGINGRHGSGGGIWNEGTLNINQSLIRENNAGTGEDENIDGGSGGGISTSGDNATFTDVVVESNSTDRGEGGGLHLDGAPTLTNITISGNQARGGGGLHIDGAPTLINVTISGNQSSHGGGIRNSGDPTLINVLISGNQATGYGGGMYNSPPPPVTPTLINVTISGNQSDSGGGMYNYYSNPTIHNSIIWGNTASESADEMYNGESGYPSNPTISNSLIQGGITGPGVVNEDTDSFITDGGGNIDGDPQFVAPVAASSAPTITGDYRLASGSVAIDAGDNFLVPAPISTDLSGNVRFADIASVTDTGSGTAPIVDMGAYEAVSSLESNYDEGQPGSIFIFVGQDLPTNTPVYVSINGVDLVFTPALSTDDTGTVIFMLRTTGLAPGQYTVTIRVGDSLVSLAEAHESSKEITLRDSGLLHETGTESVLPMMDVPDTVRPASDTTEVYLPLVNR